MEQHGAYNLLMDEYYHIGRALPGEFETLARLCRAVSESEKNSLQFVLDTYFELRAGRYHQKRIEVELDKRRQLSATRKQVAKEGWKVRRTGNGSQ